ncbi:hypothetical protein, partial [Pseudomonas viridiflava]|uniref:hypothetical protein n=1 Tax=Pseudomonas viridiflava TaxID=33069 RepID=UPI0019824266
PEPTSPSAVRWSFEGPFSPFVSHTVCSTATGQTLEILVSHGRSFKGMHRFIPDLTTGESA